MSIDYLVLHWLTGYKPGLYNDGNVVPGRHRGSVNGTAGYKT